MEFRVDTERYKYKGIVQRGIPVMDRILIYGGGRGGMVSHGGS
jgi:hypothetical protein